MDVADMLLDKILFCVDLQKQCADKLYLLATELEKHKKNVNISHVVGSSVSVGGAAAMTAAGILSIFTGGLAIPILGIGGAVVSGLALANNVGSEVVSAIISGSTMKEAKEITEKITDLYKGIQEQMKKLKEEGQKREEQAPSSAHVSEDDYVVELILRAMANRVGLHLHGGISLGNMMSALSKNTISGKDAGFSLLQRSALGLPLLSKFVIETVAKTSGKNVVSKLLPELVTTVGPKAAAKAAGRIAGGAVGLVVSVPELIINCVNLDECESEGSKTLRQNARAIQTASEDMENELQETQKVLQRLARVNHSIEKTRRSCYERETLIKFAMEHCEDKIVQEWLMKALDSESEAFFKLVDMFHFLKEKLDEEEKRNHSNTVDITFVAHGAITDSMIPACCLLPLSTITDVVLYSPWNCYLTADAAYGVATGLIEPQHRVFLCKKKEGCKIPDQKHQPTKLPNEWNSMKKAGDQKIPNIMLSPLRLAEDGVWKLIEFVENKSGRNRIVIPFILPEESKEEVPFFIVSLALSVVLFFSRFEPTLHLAACLGKCGKMKLDEDALKEQYACTIDHTTMSSTKQMIPNRLCSSFRAVFD